MRAAVPVKVSAASMRQRFHGCEPDYIANVCHASCCKTSSNDEGCLVSILPSEEAVFLRRTTLDAADGRLHPRAGEKGCPAQKPDGLCGLHFTDMKPFGCIASPFTLHAKSDTLIVRNRYRLLKCYQDDRDGEAPPAYIAFRESLRLLFPSQWRSISVHLDAGGGDAVFPMPGEVYDRLRWLDAAKRPRESVEHVEGRLL